MAEKNNFAVYAGTFDPITNGHIDIIKRALKIFDHLYIGVAQNTLKTVRFELAERVQMVQEAVSMLDKDLRAKITVEGFDGLLVNFARSRNCHAIVRGLRAVGDYEYEAQMAWVNRSFADEIETVFLVTSAHCAFVSSSIVRNIASSGGDITSLVPANVLKHF